MIPNGTTWQPESQEWEDEYKCIAHGTVFFGRPWPVVERKITPEGENGNYKPNKPIGEEKRICSECHTEFDCVVYSSGNKREICYDPKCKYAMQRRTSTKTNFRKRGFRKEFAEKMALERHPYRWMREEKIEI
jgi:hypothetical protein